MTMQMHLWAAALGLCCGAVAATICVRVARRYGLAPVRASDVALTVLVSSVAGWFGENFPAHGAPALAVLSAVVCAAGLCDLRNGHVFDALTIPAAGVLCAIAMAEGALGCGVAGAIATASPIVIARGLRRDAFGLGDAKLALCVGAFGGWAFGLAAFWIACLLAGCAGLFLIGLGRANRKGRIPFAPFFCAGTFVALLWGLPGALLL